MGDDFNQRQRDTTSLASIKEEILSRYGFAEAAGLLLRAGRAGFHYWLRENDSALGWKVVEYRLLPPVTRTRRSILDMINQLNGQSLLTAELSESEQAWRVSVRGLTGKQNRLECNFFAGMLQELCSWAGGGKFFPICECQCQSAGAERCVFLIDKLPAA